MKKNEIWLNRFGITGYPNAKYNFSPSEKYPEYTYDEIAFEKNEIYESIRNSFHMMGLDCENYGTSAWNPLGELIKPYDTVLLKPNLVLHQNKKVENGTDCLITHSSIIRAVADYVLIALKGKGRLIIGDAPIQFCDFEILVKEQGLDRIINFYQQNAVKTKVELCDFRDFKSEMSGFILTEKKQGMQQGIVVNLGKESAFADILPERFHSLRVRDYSPELMWKYHDRARNEYIVAEKILEADVIINMPKPKTHRYAGLTGALKNMVGINANKECLPHYTIGTPEENGDEYKKKSILKQCHAQMVDWRNLATREEKFLKAKIVRWIELGLRLMIIIFMHKNSTLFGAWHGNDTIWRTILDLNKIVFFADKKGIMMETQQRKILNIGDMIIAGENNGPLAPSPRKVGAIIIGEDSVCFDRVICAYMGFDFNRIPTIRNAGHISGKYNFYCQQDPLLRSNDMSLNNKKIAELEDDLVEHFIPNPCWRDYLM